MIVWLVWEFAEDAGDLRKLLRVTVAGSWVLAALTVASFASAEAIAKRTDSFCRHRAGPNDVARFLDLGFPLGGATAEQRAALAVASAGGRLSAAAACWACCSRPLAEGFWQPW